jgi:hypothetical protein
MISQTKPKPLENVRTLHYIPMPEAIAEEARRKRVDGFGHPLHVVLEKAPCRVCLRIPTEPEDLILISYRPLPDTNPYAEVGPIFIHAGRCDPYSQHDTFPADFASRRLILRAYGHEDQIVSALVAEPGEASQRAAELLSDPAVAEVHVRHESYTCFDFKIVRADYAA